MSPAYYNEYDPKAAAWLRELIKHKLIADGEVDERSITDVVSNDLKGFTQHHFFAGIGGWSYALRLAGWPDDKPVWTGSCPCQPFSSAGNNKGKKDDRHLWPHFFRLIRECKPNTVFGEQVEGAIKHGWLDDLQTDLEGEGYAVGHCVLGAHSINSAHIRQRLYWVADSKGARGCRRGQMEEAGHTEFRRPSENIWLGDTKHNGHLTNTILRYVETSQVESGVQQLERSSAGNEWVADSSGTGYQEQPGVTRISCQTDGYESRKDSSGSGRMGGRMGDMQGERCRETRTSVDQSEERITGSGIDWIYCRDGKHRPIESRIKPMVNGLPRGVVYSSDSNITPNETQEARVIRLKGYGNAIVPQVAAEFIMAFSE